MGTQLLTAIQVLPLELSEYQVLMVSLECDQDSSNYMFEVL